MLAINPLASDLDQLTAQTEPLWEDLRGGRLFLTGGTGFFGSWLLESFLWANRRFDLRAEAVVLTRDADSFRGKRPHLASDAAVRFHSGDVRSFDYPTGGFSHVVHAATPASAALNEAQPLTMLDTIVEGTRRVLNFAVLSRARKVLLTSSGAVYGKQPVELSHIPETFDGTPDTTNPRSAYAEGKRIAELLCSIYSQQYGIETKIARCFAFVGPYLPLDAHFAAGNFLRDQLRGGPIQVNGDGTPMRSYLYAADLTAWLWTILFRGESCRPYNVGSAEEISIEGLARTISKLHPAKSGAAVAVKVASRPSRKALPERYVPDVTRAARELQLTPSVSLVEALRRTSAWAAARQMGVIR